jgi:Calcium-activated chloride channel
LIRLVFSLFMTIWTTIFLEYWKRKEKYFAIRYGQVDFEEKEQERPDFKGIFKRDLATSIMNEMTYPKIKKQLKVAFGFLVSVVLIICSVIFTLFVMAFKAYLIAEGELTPLQINIIAPLINFIGAKFFAILFDVLSRKLNQYENHKSITQYENSLVWKMFLFNFFNSFNAFFVLAFIKNESDLFGKCNANKNEYTVHSYDAYDEVCYNELRGYVQTYFVSGFILNLAELLVPLLKKWLLNHKFPLKRDYDWGEIDHSIEKQWQKDNF